MTGRSARVLCAGPYILDVLLRPVSAIPEQQNSAIVEEIRITAAGTAGGTAVDLARLGVEVDALGATGSDPSGAMLRTLLASYGVGDRYLAVSGTQTSSTVLPIRPDGARRAWHVPGANALFGQDDVPWDALGNYDALHMGGLGALPGFDGEPLARLLRSAKRAGLLTTGDCLGVKRPDTLELLGRYLPAVDVFMPNDEEACEITGCDSATEAAAELHALGAATVIVTMGGDGCVIHDRDGSRRLPAMAVPVVDSTGCGDAFSAGVICSLLRGQCIDVAAQLGTAAAALTIQGLGSDAASDLSYEAVSLAASTGARRSLDPEDRLAPASASEKENHA